MITSQVHATALWSGSYAAEGRCHCVGEQHATVANAKASTPQGRLSVSQICARLDKGPTLERLDGVFNFPVYADAQCGHGPFATDRAPDPANCAGSTTPGDGNCVRVGPKWNLKTLAAGSDSDKIPVTPAAALPDQAGESAQPGVSEAALSASARGAAHWVAPKVKQAATPEPEDPAVLAARAARVEREAAARRQANEQRAEAAREAERERQLALKQARAERAKAAQTKSAQVGAKQAKAEQAKATQAKAAQAKAEQAKAEQAKTAQAKAAQVRARLAEAKRARAEQARIEQAKVEQAKVEQAKVEQAKVKQAKVKQESVEQEKLEQAELEKSWEEQAARIATLSTEAEREAAREAALAKRLARQQQARQQPANRQQIRPDTTQPAEPARTASKDSVREQRATQEVADSVMDQDAPASSVLSALRLPNGMQPGPRQSHYVDALPTRYDFGGGGLQLEAGTDRDSRWHYLARVGVASEYQEVLLGVGVHLVPRQATRLTLMLTAGVEYGKFELEYTDYSDQGAYLSLGSRAQISKRFELQGGVGYSAFFEGDEYLFGAGRYQINSRLDLTSRVRLGDNDSVGLGVRYYY